MNIEDFVEKLNPEQLNNFVYSMFFDSGYPLISMGDAKCELWNCAQCICENYCLDTNEEGEYDDEEINGAKNFLVSYLSGEGFSYFTDEEWYDFEKERDSLIEDFKKSLNCD